MNVSFDGINSTIVTFMASGKIAVGDLVNVCENSTVKKCSDNEPFIGICTSVQNDLVAVQISGFATIKINSTEDVKYGLQNFVSDENSSLKICKSEEAIAIPLNVISIDATESTVSVFL